MKTWRLATREILCGGPCRESIQPGEPYLELTAGAWTQPKRRCRHCAGEPPKLEAPPADTKRDRVEASAMTAMQRLAGAYQPGLDLREQDQ